MRELKYAELLRRNRELAPKDGAPEHRTAILSNTTLGLLKDVLEYALRSEGLPAKAFVGDYDNIVQDSVRFKDAQVVCIFLELGNLVEGLHRKAELMDDAALSALEEKTAGEWSLAFKNLAGVPLILINRFTALPFEPEGKLSDLGRRLNAKLEASLPNNARLIDAEALIAELGLERSADLRYFHSSKALYTVDFLKAWAEAAAGPALCAAGRGKKALVFDCDNTLWKGVLGEDGPAALRMSPATPDGAVFAEVQALALSLRRRGVLLCLCSKNSAAEVQEVLKSHPDAQLRPGDIAASRVDWSDKVQNLRSLASELNIGLDSIIFVDDSPFEAELVRAQLPQVRVLQVPERLEDYPRRLRRLFGLFAAAGTAEDARRTEMYREQSDRAAQKAAFASVDDYLASLRQRVLIQENDKALTVRMAQLTQKTNQFNATTRRYTETEIERLLADPKARLYAVSVTDRFGDSGVAGLVIARLDGPETELDTFLLSCRLIGRNVEFAVLDYIAAELKRRGVARVRLRYSRTAKNQPSLEFLEKSGLRLLRSEGETRDYGLELADYRPKGIAYIAVARAEETTR